MASNVVLFGWNRPLAGRERISAERFGDFVAYLTGLREGGAIESFDTVFLDPHGGDRSGAVRGATGELIESRMERWTSLIPEQLEGTSGGPNMTTSSDYGSPARRLRSLVTLAVAGLLAAPAAFGADSIVNPGVDGAAGWELLAEPGRYASEWRADDATGDPTSGSLRVENLGDSSATAHTGAVQCVAVEGGASYELAARLRVPPGQRGAGEARVGVSWYPSRGCGRAADRIGDVTPLEHAIEGEWARQATTVVAPPGAESARVELGVFVVDAGTSLHADFDDLVFDGAAVVEEAPEPPYETWLQNRELPGFDAQVRITATGSDPFQGLLEADCVAETLCARGALPGRPEVFVKVIGPRPNGFLWVQLIRFTPSALEVWLRQKSTGQINYYAVDAVAPGEGVLSGLEDRLAFTP